jgi:hypothetical protein
VKHHIDLQLRLVFEGEMSDQDRQDIIWNVADAIYMAQMNGCLTPDSAEDPPLFDSACVYEQEGGQGLAVQPVVGIKVITAVELDPPPKFVVVHPAKDAHLAVIAWPGEGDTPDDVADDAYDSLCKSTGPIVDVLMKDGTRHEVDLNELWHHGGDTA